MSSEIIRLSSATTAWKEITLMIPCVTTPLRLVPQAEKSSSFLLAHPNPGRLLIVFGNFSETAGVLLKRCQHQICLLSEYVNFHGL